MIPLTDADLAEARAYSKGSIWRQPLTGDELIATYCAIEGGMHSEPKPAPTPRKSPLIAAWLRFLRWMA